MLSDPIRVLSAFTLKLVHQTLGFNPNNCWTQYPHCQVNQYSTTQRASSIPAWSVPGILRASHAVSAPPWGRADRTHGSGQWPARGSGPLGAAAFAFPDRYFRGTFPEKMGHIFPQVFPSRYFSSQGGGGFPRVFEKGQVFGCWDG